MEGVCLLERVLFVRRRRIVRGFSDLRASMRTRVLVES
jgi:hypothetical protein